MPAATEAYSPIGSFISIALALPTAQTDTAYGQLTWIEIGEVDNIGEYGPESSTQSRTALKDGVVRKRKGPRNYGALPLTMALVPGDEGHEALLVAEDQPDPVSIKVTHGDGTVEFFRGLVMSYKRNIGGAESGTAMASANIEIDSPIVTKYPA